MRLENKQFIFSDGSVMFFGRGNFDSFCAYYKENSKAKQRALRDVEYFGTAQLLADKTSPEKFYDDFCRVYDATGKKVDRRVISMISDISKDYGDYSDIAEQTFGILYMGMLAEENKQNTKLGKKIKRLGIHNVIMENVSVQNAANFMKGMRAYEINKLCAERGF